MKRCVVTFQPSHVRVVVNQGATLLQAQIRAGLHPDAPCGGKGSCGKCRAEINGHEVLACQTVVTEDLTATIPQPQSRGILEQNGGAAVETDGENPFAMAFDLGTTTVVGYLLNGQTGEQLAHVSCVNPQTQYGADVISRIQFVLDKDPEPMQFCILSALSQLTVDAAAEAGIMLRQITCAAIAGNTAMHHLSLGIDPSPLVKPPYNPAQSKALEVSAKELLPISGKIRFLPNVAGFVGGDTVGCMLSVHFDKLDELTLLIDIGTNGEMVLGDRNRRIACSTAAGPAFEGAKISCGMRGVSGAVDHVFLKNGQVAYHVIEGGTAVGLCGSGLLDLVAVLLELGVIDGSGYLQSGVYQLGSTAVVLTQKDVRELQLAKAAIQTGIELLVRTMGTSTADIQSVMLAGAFGNYLTPASACRIGMIPNCLQKRIQTVGNAAGEGAKMCAVSREAFIRSQTIAAETEFLELASVPEFQDFFVDAMEFPEDTEC